MKHGFFKFGNFFRSTEMALFAVPVHIAIAYQIPLMFYGESSLYCGTWTKNEGTGGSDKEFKKEIQLKVDQKSKI